MRCSAVAAAALLLACSAPLRADTLIENVDGFSLDKDGKVERLSGLLIGADGRIVQVLHSGDKRPGKVEFLLDGKGRVLMPGLVDAHIDLEKLGFAALTLDLSGTRSLAEAQARIAAYAAAHPDRAWILGRGWDESRWNLGRNVTAADLDGVVADRPVWLERSGGHAGWANSAALSAAGISSATKDLPGGHIERGAAARPTGLLLETAMRLVDKVVPPPRPEDRDLALATAQNILLSQGITSATVMGTSIEAWQSMRRAGDAGTLRIRILAYADGTDAMRLIGGPGPGPWLYEDRLKFNGVFLNLDGTLATRGAWLKAPYADAPAQRGLPLLEGIQLRNLMSRAAIDRFQVAVAAHGDAAVAAALDAIDELSETYKGDRRWRIEDAEVIAAPDVARFAVHGTLVTTLPDTVPNDRTTIEARLGPARLGSVQPWASLIQAHVFPAFGTEAPTPWADLAAAITRQDAAGQPFGGWQPQERLSREAALAGLTVSAAYAGFAEGHFGRLTPGQRADFILLDRDPLLASPTELRDTKVLETWVGGQRVWSAANGASPPR